MHPIRIWQSEKLVTPDSYVTLQRYVLKFFAVFKAREIHHKYCFILLCDNIHDKSGHLARIHSSTFLSHYNILCCHTTHSMGSVTT